MYILPYICQPATPPSRPQISTSPAPSTTGQPCPERRTDGTSTPGDSPRRTAEGETHRDTARGKRAPPEAAQTAQPAQTITRTDSAAQRQRLDYCPAQTGTAPRGTAQHPRQQRRTEANGNRERERGQRGEGSEGKTAVKAPPFDHLPDWRHQPSPGHPMTPRGHQTAPDGQTAEGSTPPRFCFCGVCRISLEQRPFCPYGRRGTLYILKPSRPLKSLLCTLFSTPLKIPHFPSATASGTPP